MDNLQLIIGALDSLGIALTDHNHQWTEGERAIYEQAVKCVDAIRDSQKTGKGDKWPYSDHTARTSVKWAQRCGELQGRIETLEGELDSYKARRLDAIQAQGDSGHEPL